MDSELCSDQATERLLYEVNKMRQYEMKQCYNWDWQYDSGFEILIKELLDKQYQDFLKLS